MEALQLQPSVPSAYYCPHYCHFWEGSEAAFLALLRTVYGQGLIVGNAMEAHCFLSSEEWRLWPTPSGTTSWGKNHFSAVRLTDWHFVCSQIGILRTWEVEEEWKIILIYCVTDSKVQTRWHIMCDFNTNDYGTQYFLSFYAEELWLRLSWCYYPLPNSPDSAFFLRSCTVFVCVVCFCFLLAGGQGDVCFLLSQNLFFCPPFSFHQSLSYAKSVLYVQLKFRNTHHSTYFIFLFVVTTATPALHSYLCVVS